MTRRAAVAIVGAAASGCAAHHAPVAAAPQAPIESLPICGFESPTLPDPCRIEVMYGEWLRVSNAGPERPQRRHSWLWWLLVAGLL